MGEEHYNFPHEFEPVLPAAVEAGLDPSTGEFECQPVPGGRTTGSAQFLPWVPLCKAFPIS